MNPKYCTYQRLKKETKDRENEIAVDKYKKIYLISKSLAKIKGESNSKQESWCQINYKNRNLIK